MANKVDVEVALAHLRIMDLDHPECSIDLVMFRSFGPLYACQTPENVVTLQNLGLLDADRCVPPHVIEALKGFQILSSIFNKHG